MAIRRRAIGIAALFVLALAVWMLNRCRGRGAGNDEREHAGNDLVSYRGAPSREPVPRSRMAMRRVAGVVMMDGAPVAGAMVRLAGKPFAAQVSSKITDTTGHFDFGPQPTSKYVVAAEAPHVTGAAETIDLRDSAFVPPPDQLRLVLHACTASIHGVVTDASHVPLASARISRGDAARTASGVTTDADGRYELCVPESTSTVSVRASGYGYVEDRVTAFGPVRRDFMLVPEAPVDGHVVRAGDRAPVSDALVELQPDRGSTAPTLHARTDADGHFHFEGAAPGRHEVVASADHLASVPIVVIAEVGTANEQVTCVVEPVSTVEGTVVDRSSHAPLGGVTIFLKRTTIGGASSSPLEQPWLREDVKSRSDGGFTFERVPPGSYAAIAMRSGVHSDKPSSSFVVDRSDVAGVVVELDGGASITGHVLRAGKPVDGAAVSTDRVQAVSGADGRFVLTGLEPGKHTIYAESQREGAFTRGPTISVAKDEQRDGVDVELDLSGSIAGRVIDQDGAPVGAAMLRFSLLHTSDFGTATTADDGTFVARALSGGGSYIYEVVNESSGMAYRPLVGKRFPAIAVRDGNDHVSGVIVRVRRDRLMLAGRVVTSAGQPVPDVVVTAGDSRAENEVGPSGSRTSTDASGAFALLDLGSGEYTVTARAPNGAEVDQQATAGSSNLVLRLEDVGEIDGTLEGLDSVFNVFATRDDSVMSYTAAIIGTSFRIRNVPPGTYRVYAQSSTAHSSATVAVAAGATASVVLRPRPTGTIIGTLVDGQTSAPIASADCSAEPQPGSDADDFDGVRRTTTRPDGSFRIERVSAGDVEVSCYTRPGIATGNVHVVADGAVRLDLVSHADNTRPGYVGVTFETQLGELMVQSVAPGGPGERAGLAVGDVVVKMDGESLSALSASSFSFGDVFSWPVGTPVSITVDRGDAELTVQLVPESPP